MASLAVGAAEREQNGSKTRDPAATMHLLATVTSNIMETLSYSYSMCNAIQGGAKAHPVLF